METERIPINKGWKFSLTEDIHADESLFVEVNLPHDWQIENPQNPEMANGYMQGFFPRSQVGVYRYTFCAPCEWQGKEVSVLFDGIQRFSDIYLNGTRIGGRQYGYIPVLCTMNCLKYGEENELTVRVDNTKASELRGGGDRWYSGAGIYRNAWFIINEAAHIRHDGIFITSEPVFKGLNGDIPDKIGIHCDSAHVNVTVENEGPLDGAVLVCEVRQQGVLIDGFSVKAEYENTIAFDIVKPVLWSPDAPALYTFTASLRKPGQADSKQIVSFGIRSAVFDDEDGFILNGVNTKLWGVNFHHDAAVFGAAVPIEIWRRRLTQIKAMGMNAVRCSHNPQCEEFYDLCDELGLMVIDEYCDKWQNGGMYFDYIQDDERLEEIEVMLRRDRNHPSVILWSVGNEVSGQYSEYWFETLEKLCAKVRQLDPTRAVSCALIGFCLDGYNDVAPLGKKLAVARRYAEIVDVFMGNYMEQLYAKLRESGMRKPIIGSEVFTYYCFDENKLNCTDASGFNPYGVVRKYPWVCGAFLWAGCDYLGESTGWPSRGWTGCALDSTGEFKLRAWYLASQIKTEPILKLAVYDESEPWDRARGLWGFPQMRSHWKYDQPEKVMHVVAMTNCETVKLYQNSQTVRTGSLKDSKDGMIHFYVPYSAGVLRAEGWDAGRKTAEHVIYSDYSAEELVVYADRNELPADGASIAIVDIYLKDAHGNNYVLNDMDVSISMSGFGEIAAIDNGNANEPRDYADNTHLSLHNGHLQVYVRSSDRPGNGVLTVKADGFSRRIAEFTFV